MRKPWSLVATDNGMVVVEKGTKTAAGRRVLPLPEPLVASLRTLKARHAAERLAAGEAHHGTVYVLCDELGVPARTDWLRRRFKKLAAEAGLPPVRFYDCRHAALTHLHRIGVPLAVIAKWAGHADDGATAMANYIHPNAKDLEIAKLGFADMLS